MKIINPLVKVTIEFDLDEAKALMSLMGGNSHTSYRTRYGIDYVMARKFDDLYDDLVKLTDCELLYK